MKGRADLSLGSHSSFSSVITSTSLHCSSVFKHGPSFETVNNSKRRMGWPVSAPHPRAQARWKEEPNTRN